MLFPVRCQSCGRPFENEWNQFQAGKKTQNRSNKQILDDLGLPRECCRTTIIAYLPLIDKLLAFKKK